MPESERWRPEIFDIIDYTNKQNGFEMSVETKEQMARSAYAEAIQISGYYGDRLVNALIDQYKKRGYSINS